MDRGAWRAAVHTVTESQTRLRVTGHEHWDVSTLRSQFPIPWFYHESCDVTEKTEGMSLSPSLFFLTFHLLR